MVALILLLGGNIKRTQAAIELSKSLKGLEHKIVISGRDVTEEWRKRILDGGVEVEVIIDKNAQDTLGNFTTTTGLARDCDRVYIVTDDWHMDRAYAIGRIVYTGSGIELKRHGYKGETNRKDKGNKSLDIVRAIAWRWFNCV
jgi:hypothetical protein